MPRAKATGVHIHRIELGTYERDRLNEAIRVSLLAQATQAASSLLFGGGVLLAGMAGIYFVGLPLIEATKKVIEKVSDKAAESIEDIFPSTPANRIETLGKEVIALQEEATKLHDDMPIYCDSSKGTFSKYRCDSLQVALKANIDSQESKRAQIEELMNIGETQTPLETFLNSIFGTTGERV